MFILADDFIFPLYGFIDFCISLFEPLIRNLFVKYRFNRDEISLLYLFLKSYLCFIYKFRLKMKNKFGVRYLTLHSLDSEKGQVFIFIPLMPSLSMRFLIVHHLVLFHANLLDFP